MARIPRSVVGGMVYHVLNRANARLTIFRKKKDYEAFENILIEGKEKYKPRVLAYCIMPNHWHLVLYPKTETAMSDFMRWITHTHTQRWQAHYDLIGAGHLYQGRYKSFPVQKDEHFLQLCRYVERNPLRAKLVTQAEQWRWSSLWIKLKGSPKQNGLLSSWPVEPPSNYLSWINNPQPHEEELTKTIRTSVQRHRPFGKPSWILVAVNRLNLQSSLKPRGRPKKGT